MPINVNAGEYKSVIGLDSLYIAQVTQDDAAAYVTGTPEYLAPAAEASQEPSVSTETQYADDQPFDVLRGRGETKINLTVTGIPAEMQAKLTGGVFDSSKGLVQDDEGSPPYFALGFRSLKTNGSYRYYWFLKGTFEAPKEEAATNKDKPDAKTIQMTFTALKTIFKFTLSDATVRSIKRMYGDADTTSFSATGWFTQVKTPETTTPSALALSSSDPAAGASSVIVTKTLLLTFNNALATDAIYNVTLVNSATGAVVAGTNSLDPTRKVMTVGHTASLAAATLHRIVYAVIDVYGQTLSGIVSFTTA